MCLFSCDIIQVSYSKINYVSIFLWLGPGPMLQNKLWVHFTVDAARFHILWLTMYPFFYKNVQVPCTIIKLYTSRLYVLCPVTGSRAYISWSTMYPFSWYQGHIPFGMINYVSNFLIQGPDPIVHHKLCIPFPGTWARLHSPW